MKRVFITAIILALALPVGALAGDGFYLKKGFPVAATEAELDQFVEVIQSRDEIAFKKLLSRGRVAITARTVEVHIVKNHFMGHYEIRLPGQTVAVWTVKRAITIEEPDAEGSE